MEKQINNQLKIISIDIPEKVNWYQYNTLVLFEGVKGVSSFNLDSNVQLNEQNNKLLIIANKNKKNHHHTALALIKNALNDVQYGNFLLLRLEGSSYRAAVDNNKLILNIGYSHEVIYNIPPTVRINSSGTTICIYGTNKAEVSRVANEIYSIRVPDLYKGKGIRYFNKKIRILTPKVKK